MAEAREGHRIRPYRHRSGRVTARGPTHLFTEGVNPLARDHGRLRHTIWSDPDWRALRAEEQRVFMLALTQPGLSYSGIVPYTLRRWQTLAADSTIPKIRRAVRALQEARFVVVDEETEELCVRTFIRHDGVLDSPNICRATVRDFAAITSPLLRCVVVCEVLKLIDEDPRPGNEKSWDEVLTPWLQRTLPGTFGEPFPGTLTKPQQQTLEHTVGGTLAPVRARARAAPFLIHSIPFHGAGPRSPQTFCDVHRQAEPCGGCAADRKARADE